MSVTAGSGFGDVSSNRPRVAQLHRPVTRRVVARWLTTATLALALFMLAGAAGLGLYASAHVDRIYEGIEVNGIPVGGMTRAEASATLDARFAEFAATPMRLVNGDDAFAFTPASAGVTLDTRATVAAAMAYGRDGSVWDRSRQWARGLTRDVQIAPRVLVDHDSATAVLTKITPMIVQAPVDAAVQMDGASEPVLEPDVPGVAFDLGQTRANLIAHLQRLDTEPVRVMTVTKPAAVRAASLAPTLTKARSAVAAPLVLSSDEGVWHLPATRLKQMVSVDAAEAALRIDPRALAETVAEVAARIDQEAVDASLTVDERGALAVGPGADFAAVDEAATTANIEAALLKGNHEVAVVVERAPPAITDAEAAAAAAHAEQLIAGGLDLTWPGGRARLGRNDLLRALTITPRPADKTPYAFSLDKEIVADLLAPVAETYDQSARDARFRFIDGQIRLTAEAQNGRALDVDNGVGAVVASFGQTDPSAKLSVRTVAPDVTAADRDAIRLGGDVLAEASTYYGQSSAPRRENVEQAVALETGWLVPPDGIFSYVDNVGEVDAANGFVTGFGIIADENGGVTTAPVMGGGICQVSTTIFQAAFWAGMPIEERYQHPYYLRSYGEAPRGLPGLDAMVNIEDDWALDLKFRNATDDWLVVLLTADGENVTTRIVGTDPGWEIDVSAPIITNVVPKETQMYTTESSELPRGQELLVESAEDGFDSTIKRTVRENGKVIDTYTVSSSFAPSRNLTLRGTGPAA